MMYMENETDNVVVLNLCESEILFLKPNQIYKFEVDEKCKRCIQLKTLSDITAK